MKVAFCLAIVLGVFLSGCGPSQQNLIGKWKGEAKLPAEKKDDPMAKMGEAMLGMFTMDLELKADNKFNLTMLFIPIAGTWTLNGNIVTLQPDTVFGLSPEEFAKQNNKDGKSTTSKPEDIKKPMRLEIQPDGKSMKALDDIAGEKSPGDFVFTKQTS